MLFRKIVGLCVAPLNTYHLFLASTAAEHATFPYQYTCGLISTESWGYAERINTTDVVMIIPEY